VTHVPVDPLELQAAHAAGTTRSRKMAAAGAATVTSVVASTGTATMVPVASTTSLTAVSTSNNSTGAAAAAAVPSSFYGMSEKQLRAENMTAVFSAHGLVPPTAAASNGAGAPGVAQTPSQHLILWDRRLPTRVNQDNQRTTDAQRMAALTRDLVQLRPVTAVVVGSTGSSTGGIGAGAGSSASGASGSSAPAIVSTIPVAAAAAASAAAPSPLSDQALISELPFLRMEAKQQAVVNQVFVDCLPKVSRQTCAVQVLLNKQKQDAGRKKAGAFTRVSSRPTF
jgi:hypothetical protein